MHIQQLIQINGWDNARYLQEMQENIHTADIVINDSVGGSWRHGPLLTDSPLLITNLRIGCTESGDPGK